MIKSRVDVTFMDYFMLIAVIVCFMAILSPLPIRIKLFFTVWLSLILGIYFI